MDNKTLVTEAMTALLQKKDISVIDRYWAEPYTQHNLTMPDGVTPFRGMIQMAINNPEFDYKLVRAIGDGDYVALHNRYVGFMPQPVVAFDLFRLENGQIVEHWDGLQAEVTSTVSGRTMLDGATQTTDLEQTEANKQLVKEFVETVLVGMQYDKMGQYFDGDNYLQHNPGIGDGLSGLGKGLEEMGKQGIKMEYFTNHRVIGEGNFVLTQSEGAFGGKPYAYYDLFRVANGKIAEHWDVMQEIPAQAQNSNGMF